MHILVEDCCIIIGSCLDVGPFLDGFSHSLHIPLSGGLIELVLEGI